MKVFMINGSPHPNGCTYTALQEMGNQFRTLGVEYEIIHIGSNMIPGCSACRACRSTGICVMDDLANIVHQKLEECDAFVVGSPVYYASPNGVLLSLLDRVFYMGGNYAHKPAAAVVSARRGGTTASLDVIQKYFMISGMPLASSTYWPMVHGNTPKEVLRDQEGLQSVRALAHDLVWMARCFEAGRKSGILPTFKEDLISTNFIR